MTSTYRKLPHLEIDAVPADLVENYCSIGKAVGPSIEHLAMEDSLDTIQDQEFFRGLHEHCKSLTNMRLWLTSESPFDAVTSAENICIRSRSTHSSEASARLLLREHINRLRAMLSAIRELHLELTVRHVTDDIIDLFGPQLRKLCVQEDVRSSDYFLEKLATCTNLEELRLELVHQAIRRGAEQEQKRIANEGMTKVMRAIGGNLRRLTCNGRSRWLTRKPRGSEVTQDDFSVYSPMNCLVRRCPYLKCLHIYALKLVKA